MKIYPQIYQWGDVVEIDPSGTPGEAADLVTLVNAQINVRAKGSEPSGYLISNTTGADAFVRTDTIGVAAANSGKGIKIADGDSLWVPGIGNSLQERTWAVEASGVVYVGVYYK